MKTAGKKFAMEAAGSLTPELEGSATSLCHGLPSGAAPVAARPEAGGGGAPKHPKRGA